jgi:YrbI family 3-deoxy-D-manno-octulosonate 8-phosphate phosphatase
MTDNKVYVDQDGNEFVLCSRADGLAFDVLKKLNYNVFIVSSEKNSVVTARGNKLGIPVIQGTNSKKDILLNMHEKKQINLTNTIYIGNDLNDYNAMMLCAVKCCPADSHVRIKEISDVVLETKGGYGVAREIVENVLQIDILKHIN